MLGLKKMLFALYEASIGDRVSVEVLGLFLSLRETYIP